MKRLVAAVACVAVACGGGGSGAATTVAPSTSTTTTTTTTTTTADPHLGLREYVVAVMGEQADDSELPLDEPEARCIADATFDAIGADRFIEVGFLEGSDPVQPMSMFDLVWTQQEWDLLVDTLFDCVDVQAKLMDFLVAGGVAEAVAKCVADGFGSSADFRIAIGARNAVPTAEEEAALARFDSAFGECSY